MPPAGGARCCPPHFAQDQRCPEGTLRCGRAEFSVSGDLSSSPESCICLKTMDWSCCGHGRPRVRDAVGYGNASQLGAGRVTPQMGRPKGESSRSEELLV